MYNVNINNTNKLHNLEFKKNKLKNHYKNNPLPSTLWNILNILKEINLFKNKN